MKTNLKKWQKLSSKQILNHPRMKLVEDDVKLSDGKVIKYLHQPYSGLGGVVLICQRESKILLQKEYSYPVDEILWQLPGGKIEENETPEMAANRELAEESDLKAEEITLLGEFYPDNRRTSAKLYVVLAKDFSSEAKEADESEFIENEWVEINKIENMIKNGEVKNYAFLAAWAFFRTKILLT